MSVTTADIFGSNRAPQPAVPGSYGEAPATTPLPDALRLGPVRLIVSDLERSRAWYEQVLGLVALPAAPTASRTSDHALALALGAAGDAEPLVVLDTAPGIVPIRPGSRLGLYHFAILLPTRADLGRFVRHLSHIGARAGASDHLVSEALYLTDPDGLGIEVYADRPRESWQRLGRELMMATDPIDMPSVLAAAGNTSWHGMPVGTRMGHLHLHVGDLGKARAFYADALGFTRMVWRYPGALFLGAGGYHHHLGVNTWAGGAPSPGPLDARLAEWQVVLPTTSDVSRVLMQVEQAGFVIDQERAVLTDPWGTAMHLVAEQSAASP